MATAATIAGRIGEIDGRMEVIHKLINAAEEIDRDLASGRGTSYSFRQVQEEIEDATLYAEDLIKKLNKAR